MTIPLRMRFFLAVMAAAVALALLPGEASAQGGEGLLRDRACQEDPYSEDCICRNVRIHSRFPKNVTYGSDGTVSASGTDENGNTIPLVYDAETRTWSGGQEDDYVQENSDKYKAYCSMAYFQENQRRLIYVVIAIGSLLFGVSVMWGGFVHMQETASGESRSTSRTIIIRAAMGVILLAMVFLAWEGVSGYLFSDVEVWDTAPGFLENF